MNKKNRLVFFWGVGLFVAVADRLAKKFVISLPHHIDVIEGFFRIVEVRNTGIAFSLFGGESTQVKRAILIAISFIAIYVLHVAVIRVKNLTFPFIVAFGLILGGALGNLADRILHGYVIDFLDFYIGPYHWPAFNIADSAITTGVAILLFGVLSRKLEL